MKFSKRMDRLSKDVSSPLDKEVLAYKKAGKPVYDFTIGSPNIPPSKEIQEALLAAARDPKSYMYALHDTIELRSAVKGWYQRRYHVSLDVEHEILALQGSQEGLAHIALALCDEGDTVLIPAPSYPVFANGPRIAGALLYEMPMLAKNQYRIQFDTIPEKVAQDAKMMIVSYPNNPTGAIANDAFYEELIRFAKRYDIIVVHDTAYSELVFDGEEGKSFLYYEGAKDIGVEFNSFSKTYGMAGARIGMCVGNAKIVQVLRKLKSNIDYGMFLPIQNAAAVALTQDQSIVSETRAIYEHRRNRFVQGLRAVGWNVAMPQSTMFIWAKIPTFMQLNAKQFASKLLQETGMYVTPGTDFGHYGEGYVRIALVQSDACIEEALKALKHSQMFHN